MQNPACDTSKLNSSTVVGFFYFSFMDPCSLVKGVTDCKSAMSSVQSQCMLSVLTFLHKCAADCGRGLHSFASFCVYGNRQNCQTERHPCPPPSPSPLTLCFCLLLILSWDSTISGPSAFNMPSVCSLGQEEWLTGEALLHRQYLHTVIDAETSSKHICILHFKQSNCCWTGRCHSVEFPVPA